LGDSGERTTITSWCRVVDFVLFISRESGQWFLEWPLARSSASPP
jgi:hypothetical protein